MPHTNRKKKGTGAAAAKKDEEKSGFSIVHTKRKEVVDEEGWTHVVDTPRTTRTTKANDAAQAGLRLQGGDFEINGVSYVNRELKHLKTEFEFWKKGWEQDAACAELREIWAAMEARKKVSNVVFLGMGSLQSFRREGRRSSATQLAALQSIVSLLSDAQIRVVLQDPQFTALDKDFLTAVGYTIMEDPDAFKEIGENTLVYAIHCYSEVYKSISDGARPAVLIGTDVGNFGRFNASESHEDVARSLEGMVDGYEVAQFPQLRHDFSDTKIYWQKESGSIQQPPSR